MDNTIPDSKQTPAIQPFDGQEEIWTPSLFRERVDAYFTMIESKERILYKTDRDGEKGYKEVKRIFKAPSLAGLCNYLGILEFEFRAVILKGGHDSMGRVALYALQRLEAELLEGMREGRFKNDVENLTADVEKFKALYDKKFAGREKDPRGVDGIFSGATINMPPKLIIEVKHSQYVTSNAEKIECEEAVMVESKQALPATSIGVAKDDSAEPPIELIKNNQKSSIIE